MRDFQLSPLLQDDSGSVDVLAYLGLITIVAIGMIAGLSTLRDGVVQEYADFSWTLMSLDQSYEYTVPGPGGPVTVTYGTPLANHTQNGNDWEPAGLQDTAAGSPAIGINSTVPGGSEEAPAQGPGTFTLPTRPGHTDNTLPAGNLGGPESQPLP